MKIKVSHESPLSMLDISRKYNDYDYCLVHLCEKYPEYLQFFIDSKNAYDREILMDHSIFELGHAFDSEKYIEYAKKIKPTMIIAPDVLEDSGATIKNFLEFKSKYKDIIYNECNSIIIGVVQGKTEVEIETCYEFMSKHADMLAISFDFSYFDRWAMGDTKWERLMRGRQHLIKTLIEKKIWNWNKPHHLLGCSLPQEFSYYISNNIYNIRSVDTSNPIVHGLFDKQYNSTFGLRSKESTKLADLIEAKAKNQDQSDIIRYNIKKFKEICS